MALKNAEIIRLYYQTVQNTSKNTNENSMFLQHVFRYVLELFIISSHKNDKSYDSMQINEFRGTHPVIDFLSFFFNNEPVSFFIYFSVFYHIAIFCVKSYKSFVLKDSSFMGTIFLLFKIICCLRLVKKLISWPFQDFSTQLLQTVNSNFLFKRWLNLDKTLPALMNRIFSFSDAESNNHTNYIFYLVKLYFTLIFLPKYLMVETTSELNNSYPTRLFFDSKFIKIFNQFEIVPGMWIKNSLGAYYSMFGFDDTTKQIGVIFVFLVVMLGYCYASLPSNMKKISQLRNVLKRNIKDFDAKLKKNIESWKKAHRTILNIIVLFYRSDLIYFLIKLCYCYYNREQLEMEAHNNRNKIGQSIKSICDNEIIPEFVAPQPQQSARRSADVFFRPTTNILFPQVVWITLNYSRLVQALYVPQRAYAFSLNNNNFDILGSDITDNSEPEMYDCGFQPGVFDQPDVFSGASEGVPRQPSLPLTPPLSPLSGLLNSLSDLNSLSEHSSDQRID